MHPKEIPRDKLNRNLRTLQVDLSVDGISTQEPVDVHMLRLSMALDTANRLSLVRDIDFLRRREKRRKEDGVVGIGEVGATRTLVHDVQQEHALLAVVLELLEVLALHRCRAFDLEEGNLVGSECFSDLGGKVRELDEDEDTLVLGNGASIHECGQLMLSSE